jgi:Viral BACON domain/Putative binding domain, N-terminal
MQLLTMATSRTAVLLFGLSVAAVLAGCGHKDRPTSTGAGTPATPTAPTAPPTAPEPPTAPTPQACAYTLAADPDDFDRDGGNGRLTIATAAGCKWTITGDATWVAVEGPTQGEGPATLKFSAQANNEAPERRMTLAVADKSVVIAQPGQGDCSYQVTPTSAVLPRPGQAGDITVTTAPGCKWTATTDATWLRLGAASASGSGRLPYSADANPGSAVRSSPIKIRWVAPTAGQNVFVAQRGTCSVAAAGEGSRIGDPLTVAAAGATAHVFVLVETPFSNCPWSVTINDPWLVVESPRSGTGSGDGDVFVRVAANPSAQSRQGVLDFGEYRLTVVQAGR